MTDKQIIIDGVDVSECSYYQHNMCTATKDGYGDCSLCCQDYDMNDCYYKQLARKEQECEELKKRLESFQKDYSKLYQVVENKGYIKELDQLKIENNQFKQTLTEIKEIIKQGVKIHDDIIVSKQILQKINECEMNNENIRNI